MLRTTCVCIGAVCLMTLSSQARVPVQPLWEFSSGGHHIRCLSSIEDMDGSGRPDVLVEIDYTGAPDGHFKLLKGEDGTELWGVSPAGGASDGCGYGDMCVNVSPDLDGDGRQEALLGTAWGGRTAYAILADQGGAILWDFDTYVDDPPSGWVYSLDWIPDVTGDGVPEIVFGCGSDNNNAYCVDGASGAVVWKFAAPDAVYQVARIGDVNGNGTTDVLVATGDTYGEYTYCVDGGSSGYATYIWRFYVGDTSYTTAGIRDVNQDGIPDAIVGTWDSDGHVFCVSGADGSLIWSYSVGYYTSVMRVVPMEDLNDDGYMEVLVASWKNAVICLDGRTGEEYWSVPTGTTNGGDVWAIWPLSDVDYDGYADVVAGSFDLKAYCVSGRSGELIWDYTVGNRVYTVRGLGDVNGDGVGEALVGTQYYGGTGGTVFCLDADGDGTAVPAVEGVACRSVSGGVLVSWTGGLDGSVVGFNVYRADLSDVPPPAALRARLAEDGIDSAAEVLAARASLGARGGFEKLNRDLVTGEEYLDATVVAGARYAYLVGAVTGDGREALAGPVEITVVESSTGLALAPPASNPAPGGAVFVFAAPPGESVALSIYDLAGRLVRNVYRGTASPSATAAWDGRDAAGARTASGVYFVRLNGRDGSVTRKITLVTR